MKEFYEKYDILEDKDKLYLLEVFLEIKLKEYTSCGKHC